MRILLIFAVVFSPFGAHAHQSAREILSGCEKVLALARAFQDEGYRALPAPEHLRTALGEIAQDLPGLDPVSDLMGMLSSGRMNPRVYAEGKNQVRELFALGPQPGGKGIELKPGGARGKALELPDGAEVDEARSFYVLKRNGQDQWSEGNLDPTVISVQDRFGFLYVQFRTRGPADRIAGIILQHNKGVPQVTILGESTPVRPDTDLATFKNQLLTRERF